LKNDDFSQISLVFQKSKVIFQKSLLKKEVFCFEN